MLKWGLRPLRQKGTGYTFCLLLHSLTSALKLNVCGIQSLVMPYLEGSPNFLQIRMKKCDLCGNRTRAPWAHNLLADTGGLVIDTGPVVLGSGNVRKYLFT